MPLPLSLSLPPRFVALAFLALAAITVPAAAATEPAPTAAPASAATADEAAPSPAFKFTTGLYRSTGGGLPASTGLDLNLRHSSDWGNAWIGWYRSADADVTQTRIGWDHTFDLGAVRLQPSLQAASGGFYGGSLYLETGDTWFAGAGLGRTNLRPYVNLNFDPNDAWTLAAGRRWGDNHALTLMLVGDNREQPDQRHLHLNYRLPLADGERLTLDLLAKRGLVDGALVHRLGLTVGYDWRRHFVRIAWDPKSNFTPQDMLRLSAGLRF